MKAMLLRVGIDTGTDEAYGPIFSDGSFEFIPISDRWSTKKCHMTYRNTIGRNGKPLSTYLPERIADRHLHYDPEFETFTYGEDTKTKGKVSSLKKLQNGDLLVFYAGLAPFDNSRQKKGLYIIGYFTFKGVIDFKELSSKEIIHSRNIFSNNAHVRTYEKNNFIIIQGDKDRSRLLDKAILISEKGQDKAGRTLLVLSKQMESLFGIKGSIQRSTPRRIEGEKNIDNLRGLLEIHD